MLAVDVSSKGPPDPPCAPEQSSCAEWSVESSSATAAACSALNGLAALTPLLQSQCPALLPPMLLLAVRASALLPVALPPAAASARQWLGQLLQAGQAGWEGAAVSSIASAAEDDPVGGKAGEEMKGDAPSETSWPSLLLQAVEVVCAFLTEASPLSSAATAAVPERLLLLIALLQVPMSRI